MVDNKLWLYRLYACIYKVEHILYTNVLIYFAAKTVRLLISWNTLERVALPMYRTNVYVLYIDIWL